MNRFGTLLLAVLFVLLQSTTATVRAETLLPANVVINEIQTNGPGSGTTLQEFIELVNVSNMAVDISGYKVIYTNSSATNFDLTEFGVGTTLNPGGHIVLTPISATNDFLPDISPKISYVAPSSSGMAASGGKVSLVNISAVVLDTVQWVNSSAAATGEIIYYTGNGKSIQRKVVDSLVAVSASSKNDFELLDIPTPVADNVAPVVDEPDPDPEPNPEPETPVETPAEELPTTPVDETPTDTTEQPVETPFEPATPVYLPILINELYIDPTSPQTDANDEWIELYNPNDTAVDITGYTVYAGANFTYKHVFLAGSTLAANSYLVLTSGATTLAFSNGGGGAKITAPNTEEFDATSYIEAPEGQAWAKNTSGAWEWTTTPTEDAANIITVPLPPVLKAAALSSAKAKKATTAKVTSVKAATTKAAKVTKAKAVSKSNVDEPLLINAPTPIPSWLLAVLVLLALLYVAYEYRFEAANSIYRFRNHRSTRR